MADSTKVPKVTPSTSYERRTIVVNSTLTAVTVTLFFQAMYALAPLPVPHLPTLTDRLVYTLRLQAFPCLTLVVGVLITSLARLFTSAVDPINGRSEHLVAVKVRFVTTTLEQYVISATGQLILTTYLAPHQMKAIPILVLIFVVGRILFYFGYSASYLKRSPGYIATFGVNVILWCVVTYLVVTDLFL